MASGITALKRLKYGCFLRKSWTQFQPFMYMTSGITAFERLRVFMTFSTFEYTKLLGTSSWTPFWYSQASKFSNWMRFWWKALWNQKLTNRRGMPAYVFDNLRHNQRANQQAFSMKPSQTKTFKMIIKLSQFSCRWLARQLNYDSCMIFSFWN